MANTLRKALTALLALGLSANLLCLPTPAAAESSAGLTSVGPEAYVGRQGMFDEHFRLLFSGLWPEEAPEGYSYRYVGYGEHSRYYVHTQLGQTSGLRATMFQLRDEDGFPAFVYCADLQTSAVKGAWYSVSNLEDCSYYAAEGAAGHIRAIAAHGYWGASNQADEDGRYQTGSLASIKAALLEAISSGDIENISVSTGSETVPLSETISGLTEGEALLATQAAIWSYANGSLVVRPSHDSYNNLGAQGEARVEALYTWLRGLAPEAPSTIVINQQNFVENIRLTAGDRTADGACQAALSFTLAFTPGHGDDLLLHLSYTDPSGESVVLTRRLAGAGGDGGDRETLSAVNGVYTIEGLTLSAGKDAAVHLRVTGMQRLEQDAYVYTAQGGASQTFVGLTGGSRPVDAALSATFSLGGEESSAAPEVPADLETPADPEGPAGQETAGAPEEPLASAPKTGNNLILWMALSLLSGSVLLVMLLTEEEKDSSK